VAPSYLSPPKVIHHIRHLSITDNSKLKIPRNQYSLLITYTLNLSRVSLPTSDIPRNYPRPTFHIVTRLNSPVEGGDTGVRLTGLGRRWDQGSLLPAAACRFDGSGRVRRDGEVGEWSPLGVVLGWNRRD